MLTTSTLTSIDCLSHDKVDITYEEKKGNISLENTSLNLANFCDFVVEIGVLCLSEPIALVEYEPVSDSYAVLLSYLPDLTAAINPKDELNSEFVFVVDCSGSMGKDLCLYCDHCDMHFILLNMCIYVYNQVVLACGKRPVLWVIFSNCYLS